MLSRILDKVPFGVIWWIDSHLNHVRYPNGTETSCVSRWFCDYADYRCMLGFEPEKDAADGTAL